MSVDPTPAEGGGLAPAQAAALVVLMERYASLRQSQSVAAVAALRLMWRSFLLLGSTRSVRSPAEARSIAAAAAVSRADFARSVPWRIAGDALYDRDAVTQIATQMASRSADQQRQAANLAGEFERQMLQVVGVTTKAPIAGPVVSATAESSIATSRLNVDPVAVYQRPAERYRYEQSIGANVASAMEAAELRLEQITANDLTLAERDAFWDIINGPDVTTVTGYRRVIRPELSRFGSCGLCIVAADRVYSRGDLLPIHGGCNCIVMPVVDGLDPGLNLNAPDLKRLYGAAGGSTAGKALRRIRVQSVEHGELGPVLVRSGQRFTDAATQARRTTT